LLLPLELLVALVAILLTALICVLRRLHQLGSTMASERRDIARSPLLPTSQPRSDDSPGMKGTPTASQVSAALAQLEEEVS
jgi:hypothetical protein